MISRNLGKGDVTWTWGVDVAARAFNLNNFLRRMVALRQGVHGRVQAGELNLLRSQRSLIGPKSGIAPQAG